MPKPLLSPRFQEVALSDVRKSINFCKKINKDIVGIIENMSGYVCPHCGKTADLFAPAAEKPRRPSSISVSWVKFF
ncbi:MAG: P-loop NTPase [Desulfobacterales bacterium]